MRAQMGALFQGGFRPDDIMDMTWDQAIEASICVRAYHLDLADTLLKGESPVLKEARREASERRWRSSSGDGYTGPVAAEEAQTERARAEAYNTFMQHQQAHAGSNSMMGFKRREGKGASPDLFAEFRRRKTTLRDPDKEDG